MKRLLGLVLVAGCAASAAPAPRATITVVRNDVHEVCLDGAAFRVGEPVRFVRSLCAPLNAKSSVVHCAAQPVATGEVLRVDGKGCAEVRVSAGAALQSGDGVELAAR
jgi:hypothetical protein